jgi:hypothetical protein
VADALPFPVDLDELINVRARLLGLTSRGRTSAGGSCRLLPTADGWVAVSLPRTTDLEAVPAIVEDVDAAEDPWGAMERFASGRPCREVADRCQLLDVAAATLDDPTVHPEGAVVRHEIHRPGATTRRPVVVDLSAMWAGPLCARLLGLAGMRVIKVESVDRPDGTRGGDPRFFSWLHDGHESRNFDFRDSAGRAGLARLLARADVVIESSRPRALRRLGIEATEFVAERPGRVWVSITGYGRTGVAATRVAFGDDAAVAGGLVAHDRDGLPQFCADAIADPMTGLFAADAAFSAIASGGGQLVEVAMASVARSLQAGPRC